MHQRILVPVDGSETAERGLCEAIALAQGSRATLALLNVVRGTTLVMDGMSMACYNEVIDLLLSASSMGDDRRAGREVEGRPAFMQFRAKTSLSHCRN